MRKLAAIVLLALVLAFSTTTLADSLAEYLQTLTDSEFSQLYKLVTDEYARRQSTSASTSTSTGNMLIGEHQLNAIKYCVPAAYQYSNSNGDYLVIQYDWTNTSKESVMFITSIMPKAFQDGIEMTSGFVLEIDTNASTSVLPGYSTTSYSVYKLKSKNDVLLYVDEFMDLANNYDDVKLTIKLDSLETWK